MEKLGWKRIGGYLVTRRLGLIVMYGASFNGKRERHAARAYCFYEKMAVDLWRFVDLRGSPGRQLDDTLIKEYVQEERLALGEMNENLWV